MATLRPVPLDVLLRRAARELDGRATLFDLPLSRAFLGDPGLDLSVDFHGRQAATPFGPAAGPHTQLAQNIVLAWLGGGRIIELKTVQANDRIVVPRPCIDVRTVGYNVEWSQELRLAEALEEYVKASMLVELLVASGRLTLAPGQGRTCFDLSLGYDLAGITNPRIQRFIALMLDAGPVIEHLRRQIPEEWRPLRDLPFTRRVAGSVTLSTFHGCPPDEIARIATFLMTRCGLDCIVKFNPTLLGPVETRGLLADVLGHDELRVPDEAFVADPSWARMVDLVGTLREVAAREGRRFGVKFTNTLIVENRGGLLPASEPVAYLSGRPLHVVAVRIVARFRHEFGDTVPVSFSGGVDRHNFADVVAMGLVPVTVCTDLLRTRGYGRSRGYFDDLCRRMREAGATSIDEWTVLGGGCAREALAAMALDEARTARCLAALEAAGTGPPVRDACDDHTWRRWVSAARLEQTRRHAERVLADPYYRREAGPHAPRKIGRRLQFFDCLSCDKCVPVCPNDANFTFTWPRGDLPRLRARRHGETWTVWQDGTWRVSEAVQYGNVADLCNDCGNCDVFCPEDGGPYLVKARFFSTVASLEAYRPRDGVFVAGSPDAGQVWGRFGGREYVVHTDGPRVRYAGEGFAVTFVADDIAGTLEGDAAGEIDLVFYLVMDGLRRAVLDAGTVNYLNCLTPSAETGNDPRSALEPREKGESWIPS